MPEWQTIVSAPDNSDLEVSIFDRDEYHALVFPCRREQSGWRDTRTGRIVPVAPTHWRRWPDGN